MGALVDHLLFAALWASFGIVHTALAGARAKALLAPLVGDFYRLSYNLLASLQLAGILYVEWRFFPDRLVFDFPDGLRWTLWVAQGVGWAVIVWALAQYDLGRFSGLAQARPALERYEQARQRARIEGGRRPPPRQSRSGPPPDAAPETGPGDPPTEPEPLRTGGPLRYVRHPLYSGLFLVLWSRAFDEFALASAVWGSAYLVVGTRFEERRLLCDYGDAYRRYRDAVPAYLPWRGRAWAE